MKMTTTMRLTLVLAMAMIAGPMAAAQQTAMPPVINMAKLDLQAPGLSLQISAGASGGSQPKDDLFAGTEKFAQGASEATEIDLDPSTMGLIGRSHGRDADEARKMKSMVIHTYKYDKPGMYRAEDLEAYRKKLADGSWHCAIHVRTTTGSTDICSRTAADQTNEMAILTAEPQKLTFIHMSGKMSLDELDDMSGTAGNFKPHTGLPNPPKMPIAPKAPVVPVAPTPPSVPQ